MASGRIDRGDKSGLLIQDTLASTRPSFERFTTLPDSSFYIQLLCRFGRRLSGERPLRWSMRHTVCAVKGIDINLFIGYMFPNGIKRPATNALKGPFLTIASGRERVYSLLDTVHQAKCCQRGYKFLQKIYKKQCCIPLWWHIHNFLMWPEILNQPLNLRDI